MWYEIRTWDKDKMFDGLIQKTFVGGTLLRRHSPCPGRMTRRLPRNLLFDLRKKRSGQAAGWLGVIVLGLASCARPPADPLDQSVTFTTLSAQQQWRGRIGRDVKPEQAADIDVAIQELKFQAMAGGVSGSEAIAAAVAEQTNGKTVRQLIELGLCAKLDRLEEQRNAATNFLAQNALLVTRDTDPASTEYLAKKRSNQLARRNALDTEIAAVRERMKADGITPPEPKPENADHSTAAPVAEEHPDTAPQLQHR